MTEQDLIQKKVIDLWYQNNCKGTALLATGSGKSKILIDIVIKEKIKTLIVVPTEKLRDRNWKLEFETWGQLELFKKYVTICCYASLKKMDLSLYSLAGLDEVHNVTPDNIEPFRHHYKRLKIICLTATEPREDVKKDIIYNKLKCPVLYTLTLKEAIDRKIVAPLSIYVHELALGTEKNYPVKYKDKTTGLEKTFYQSELEMYNYINKRLYKKLNPTQFDYLFRAKFIYNSKTKTEYAKKLLAGIPSSKRIIIFSQSVKQIDELVKETYHSKTDDKNYNLFVNEKINRLGVVNSLNEGDNIKNLDIGVIVQGNSNPKNLFQRIGRIIRKRNGHSAVIHLIILKDTVDETWYQEILQDYKELITIIK